jgi:hypothetical protein
VTVPDQPTVRIVPQVVIEWPDPKPETFEIGAELFETIVVELNMARIRGTTPISVTAPLPKPPPE